MVTAADNAGVLDRHHFLLRRLHSLSGIVPVGVFLINHLLTNYTAFEGASHFDEHVLWIHKMPMLLLIEIFGIFLPIAFHAGYGVIIALQGRSNVGSYPYMDNWRYSLQRITAWITLVFIIVHLGHFRFAHWFGVMEYKDAKDYFFFWTQWGFAELLLPMWAWIVVYCIGLTAAVFHFCNGIVTFCITWGITVNDSSRQKLSLAAGFLGLVLLTWGGLSLYAIATYEAGADRTPGPTHPISEYVGQQNMESPTPAES